MTAPRESWTDERLDELNRKVDDGFARADKKMDDGFARLDTDIRELRSEMNTRFDRFDARFDRLTWGLLASAAGIIAALIGSNAF